MKTISDFKESVYLLEKYKGSHAQLWAYNISLKRLLIKLSNPIESDVLLIIVVGCEHITGPFSWKNSNILVKVESDRKTSAPITIIKDEVAGFELVSSGGIALAQGPESDFVTSFNF